jgi:hypothetical protein
MHTEKRKINWAGGGQIGDGGSVNGKRQTLRGNKFGGGTTGWTII